MNLIDVQTFLPFLTFHGIVDEHIFVQLYVDQSHEMIKEHNEPVYDPVGSCLGYAASPTHLRMEQSVGLTFGCFFESPN